MRILISLIIFLLSSKLFSQDIQPSTDPNGPQITFDQNEIIDTITPDKLDEATGWVLHNQYEFHFTNTGKEPLFVGQSAGSDPDFNCDWTHEPIKPGGRGVIVICAYEKRYRMDKKYIINSNSVTQQIIHIQRVNAVSDSDLVINRRKYESHCMRIYVDSMPYKERDTLKNENNRNLVDHSYYLIDTTKYYLSFDDKALGMYGYQREKNGADIPYGTVLRTREEEYIIKWKPGTLCWTDYYYDDQFALLQKRITTIKDLEHQPKGGILFNVEIISYKNGVETGRENREMTN
jgi:hypothetical protein